MPRRSNAEAAQTRAAIIDRAVETASIEGLEGVTIGKLADDLGLSKAGVIGHFGSKADLQRAALHQAWQVFTDEVWEPCKDEPGGLPRLQAIARAWVKHLTNSPFPGGCFMCTVSMEWDARGGELHDEVVDGWRRWSSVLQHEARKAVEAGDLDADPDQVAFEMMAIAMGLNQAIQLLGDRKAATRARAALSRLLGSA
jgi:AcrR family transcriptional regulator